MGLFYGAAELSLGPFVGRYSLLVNHRRRKGKTELFTIGYQRRTLPALVRLLKRSKVQLLVDVRWNPRSRRQGFSKNALRNRLKSHGIAYAHIRGLGIPKNIRQRYAGLKRRNALLAYYEKRILPRSTKALEELRQTTNVASRVALLCYELHPEECHRSRLARRLAHFARFNATITHL